MKVIFILLLNLGIGHFTIAQKQKIATKSNHYSPVIVKTFIGKYGNNAVISIEEAKSLLSQPLTVLDSKSKTFPLVTYSFLFKRKGIIENEQTGVKTSSITNVSDHFQTTPLPALWIKNINEGGFVKDEEFYFFDIVVKNEKGVNIFAPDIKIKIQ